MYRAVSRSMQQKSNRWKTPFTRSPAKNAGDLFIDSVYPIVGPCLLHHHRPRSTRYKLDKRFSSVLTSRLTLLARNPAPYLGQIAPVAVFTARERARSVYPGVFGRAVLATLPIGLPRPFLLLRAADIGPTVKTHCLFPPPLREPNRHAMYTERHEGRMEVVGVRVLHFICRVYYSRRDSQTSVPSRFRQSVIQISTSYFSNI